MKKKYDVIKRPQSEIGSPQYYVTAKFGGRFNSFVSAQRHADRLNHADWERKRGKSHARS